MPKTMTLKMSLRTRKMNNKTAHEEIYLCALFFIEKPETAGGLRKLSFCKELHEVLFVFKSSSGRTAKVISCTY